jgi:ABC-type sugar transport system ATPase subunit
MDSSLEGSLIDIELRNIKNFILKGINLNIHGGELFVFLGPTGAGKTTLLNIISGLIRYEGEVFFNGKSMNHTHPRDRRIGYVFQKLALFPHLNVQSNIAFGLRAQKWIPARIEKRVNEILGMMDLHHLADRYPGNLSGGEKQKVALARAIAPSPRILLLDEPFQNIDLRSTKMIRLEFKRLQRDLEITTLFVTHQLPEAEEMADRLAILNHGRVEQIGLPKEILSQPKNEFVSNFIGSPNILRCLSSVPLGSGLIEADCDGMKVILPHEGGRVKDIMIPSKDVFVSSENPPGPYINRFKGQVIAFQGDGALKRIRVEIGKHLIDAEVPEWMASSHHLNIGQEVYVVLKLGKIMVNEG